MGKVSKEDLEEHYLNGKMTYVELAERFGCSVSHVFNLMRLYGISPRKGGRRIGLEVSQSHRESLSKGLKGIPKSKEHKANLSKSKLGCNNPRFGKPALHPKRYWYTCPDGEKVSMRSNWEVCYAEWLTAHNINWQYEPRSFKLSDGSCYTPDFYLPASATYVEVKGWLHEKHKNRLKLFRQAHPGENWVLADKIYLTSIGCDLSQQHECESRPKLKCKECGNEFFYKDKRQVVCSVKCRNKYILNPNRQKVEQTSPSREYKGNQKGSANNSSKLNEQDVLDIVKLRSRGMKLKELAKLKNTSVTNASSILSGKSWSYLTGIQGDLCRTKS